MTTSRRGDEPVLLVHGFMDTWYMPWWNLFKRYLYSIGYGEDEVYQTNNGRIPGTTVGSPKKYAENVGEKVEEIHDEHGKEVDIIAHSKGGLDSRWYGEQMDGDSFIDSLVTIGTPHRGTIPTYLAFWTPGGRDMAPNSDFLKTLNQDGLSPKMDYTAIWSTIDMAVIPQSRAQLPHEFIGDNARNIKAGAWGHMEMVWRKPVINKYVRYL